MPSYTNKIIRRQTVWVLTEIWAITDIKGHLASTSAVARIEPEIT